MIVVLVAAGGAAGACLRYILDRGVGHVAGSAFPWGTLVVNVLGSLVLGLLTGLAWSGVVSESVRLLVGTGLCGSLSTFSTFGYETVRLFGDGTRGYAVLNVAGTIVAGLSAAAAGLGLAAALV